MRVPLFVGQFSEHPKCISYGAGLVSLQTNSNANGVLLIKWDKMLSHEDAH
jgi:hypothetical protein